MRADLRFDEDHTEETPRTDHYTKLLLLAQKGDTRAFAELHAALVPSIRRYIISLDGQLSPADRDDLIQETVSAFWQKLHEYRGEASVMTFALTIARNLTLTNMSKRRRSPVVYAGDLSDVLGERELCEQSPSLFLESSESQEEIQQAMDWLTDVQRQAIELAQQDISRSEAVRLANCNPNQFANRLWRGVLTLRRLLNDLRCLLL